MQTRKNRPKWSPKILLGFFLGSASILLGLPTASASTGDSNEPDSSPVKRLLDVNQLSQEARQNLQEQIADLAKRYTTEQLSDAIFGLDENGELQIIGTKSDLRDLKFTKEQYEQLAGRHLHGPTSG